MTKVSEPVEQAISVEIEPPIEVQIDKFEQLPNASVVAGIARDVERRASSPTIVTEDPPAPLSIAAPISKVRKNYGDLNALNILRIWWTMWIFIYHTRNETYDHFVTPTLDGYISNGYFGVECFFMLSGFILTFVNLPRFYNIDFCRFWWQWAKFFTGRMARLYPLHFLVNYSMYYFEWDCSHDQLWRELSLSWGWTSQPFAGCNGPSWFIHIEVYLCLALPPILYLLAYHWIFAAPLAVGIYRVYMIYFQQGSNLIQLGPFVMEVRGLFCFGAGVILAVVYSLWRRPNIIFDVFLVFAVFKFLPLFYWYNVGNVTLFNAKMLYLMAIIYCSARAVVFDYLANAPFFKVLGELCFGIYITQLIVFRFIWMLVWDDFSTKGTYFFFYAARAFALTVLISVILYYSVEHRARAFHGDLFRFLERKLGIGK